MESTRHDTQTAFCRHCGAQATPGNSFCGACGQPLAAPAPAPTPVATPAAAAKKGKVFAIIGAVLMLAFAFFRTIEAIVFIAENERYFERSPLEALTDLGGLLVGVAAAVLIAIQLFSGKNRLLFAVGIAVFLTVGDIAMWPGFFSALGILFVLAFAVFSSYPALHGKLKWFTRLWFVPLALFGTGLTVGVIMIAAETVYATFLTVFTMLLEYAAMVMLTLWLKSNVDPAAGADTAYNAGDALARLGALLFFVFAYDSMPHISFDMDIESFPWLFAYLLYAAGIGMLGVLLLLRKKNICLVIAPSVTLTGVLIAAAMSSIGLSTLLDLSLWSAVAAFGVFNGIPALQSKAHIVNRLWFIPAAVVATSMTYFFLSVGVISPLLLAEAAAVALYPLWIKVSSK